MRQDSIAVGVASVLSEQDARDQARSTVDGVDALVQRFMTLRESGGRISPMDRISRTRTYASNNVEEEGICMPSFVATKTAVQLRGICCLIGELFTRETPK